MTDLRTIIAEALAEVDADRTWSPEAVRDLGLALQGRLHAAGMAIHDVDRCIRPVGPKAEEIGRPWAEVMAGPESTS